MKNLGLGLATVFIFLLASQAWAQESFPTRPEIIGKTHTVLTTQSFSGPGSEIPGLATTYDMSLFEMNWGARQSTFNGSGITTNANYPLTEGDALTNNTHIGLESALSPETKIGFLMELYSLVGDRTVGRVFGEELPWDNFPRENGLIETPHFQTDLYHGFVKSKGERWDYQFLAGTLTPDKLPEFSRKEFNQVKLGNLVYRAPITNESFFEKEDRKLEKGRHPLRGVDFLGDYEYAPKKHAHLEIFTGATEPTPVSDLERDAYGARAAMDILDGNVGFTYVVNDGLRPTTGVGENQSVWSIDSSYNLADRLVPYFTFAQTDYERENTGESHDGAAYVAGAALKNKDGYELKAQYQRLEENYELMGYHKGESYPANFQGLNAQGTVPMGKDIKLKGVVYYLKQIDLATDREDTLFGDSFYPSIGNSKKGTIGVERVSLDWKCTPELSFNGYVEHVKFRKEAPAILQSIDKDVYNFSGNLVLKLAKHWSLEGGLRHFFSVGNWQAMNFRSYQMIPKGALSYTIDEDHHANLIYHYVDFEDHVGAAQGRNDYHGHQVIFEIKTLL